MMRTHTEMEQSRNWWRLLWRVLTSDALWLALGGVVGLGCVALATLPQAPSDAIVDPAAYSRWDTEARERSSALFPVLQAVGLLRVEQAIWWRAALALWVGVLTLRLLHHLAAWFSASYAAALTQRYAITFGLDELGAWAHRLRQHGWRVTHRAPDELLADRAPRASGLAALLHVGLLSVALGLLGNAALGWQVNERLVTSNEPFILPFGETLRLAENAGDLAMRFTIQPGDRTFIMQDGEDQTQAGIWLKAHRLQTGYRLSAVNGAGEALTVRVSTLGAPSDQAILLFSDEEPERFAAIPEAALGVVLRRGDPPELADRVQVLALPRGDLLVEGIVKDQLSLGEVTLRLQPMRAAIFSAHYQPLDGLIVVGSVLALIGAAGAVLYPAQQVVVRHRHGWTELCAAGWRARRAIAALMQTS